MSMSGGVVQWRLALTRRLSTSWHAGVAAAASHASALTDGRCM
jgi:hypothetical protein